MHLRRTVSPLFCTSFFESLLQNIDLCQLDALARECQIGWCSEVIRNECFLVIARFLVPHNAKSIVYHCDFLECIYYFITINS